MLRGLLWAGFVGAVVAHTDLLASNNLLPRRVAFHFAAVAALGLLASRRPRPARVPIALGLLAALGVTTWALSPVRSLALPGLVDLLSATVLAAVVGTMPLSRRQMVLIVLGLGGIGAALGLLEQYAALPLGDVTRPAGWFASRATAAAFCAAALALAWWRRVPRLGSFVLTVVLVAFIVATRARTAWVASVFVTTGLLLVLRERRRELLLAALLGVVLAVAATPGPLLSWRSSTPYADSASTLARVELGDRLSVWRAVFESALRRPWGSGPGSFEAAFAPFAPAELVARDVRVESPHDEFLRVLFELGPLGLVAVFWLFRGVTRHVSRRTWMLRLALLALLICSFTGKTFEEPPTLVLAAFLVGLQLRAQRRFRFSALRVALAVASLALLTLVAFADGSQLRASRGLARARQAQQTGRHRMAWELAEPQLAHARDLGAWLWAVDLLGDSGDVARCDAAAEEALVLAPRHPLLLRRQADCRR